VATATAAGQGLAGAATAAEGARPGARHVAFATPGDDADVRALLKRQALPGEISLSFEREPSALGAGSIEGDVHQILIARNITSGQLEGLASRSVRTAFVNGRPERLGYLSLLRVEPGVRGLRSLLDDGFSALRAAHATGGARFYIMSVVAGSDVARRLLFDRRSSTAPRFTLAGRYSTFAIPVRQPFRASTPDGIDLMRGRDALIEDIAACLDRNLARWQFAPSWSAADLMDPVRTRGLRPDDFLVATCAGRVVGCAALWDQRAFRQTVVRGYRTGLRRVRPLINFVARPLALPRLPAVGAQLDFAYLSHLAVDDEREDVARALVRAISRLAAERGREYIVVGCGQGHPLHGAIARAARHRVYATDIHVAAWPDGQAAAAALDGRPLQPEVAVL
jgi:hypothetical protein